MLGIHLLWLQGKAQSSRHNRGREESSSSRKKAARHSNLQSTMTRRGEVEETTGGVDKKRDSRTGVPQLQLPLLLLLLQDLPALQVGWSS